MAFIILFQNLVSDLGGVWYTCQDAAAISGLKHAVMCRNIR